MPVEILIRYGAVRPRERMNSPLEIRKVRLRGLGGPEACGVPGHRCVRNRESGATSCMPYPTQ
jgi:hypothetical protein